MQPNSMRIQARYKGFVQRVRRLDFVRYLLRYISKGGLIMPTGHTYVPQSRRQCRGMAHAHMTIPYASYAKYMEEVD